MRAKMLTVVAILIPIMLGLGVLPVAQAQDGHGALLLVLAKKDERLSLVDPATLKVVATVPSGGNSHEVIASPDGSSPT